MVSKNQRYVWNCQFETSKLYLFKFELKTMVNYNFMIFLDIFGDAKNHKKQNNKKFRLEIDTQTALVIRLQCDLQLKTDLTTLRSRNNVNKFLYN